MFYLKNNKKTAFTLLEMVVVITIIAIIGTMAISASRDMIDNANLVATQNRMDAIEKALFNFWKKNGRIPCPAYSGGGITSTHEEWGIEADVTLSPYDCSTGTTAAATPSSSFAYKASEGAVPVRTLNLPDDFMYDGYGRKFTYGISPAFALPNSSKAIPPKSGVCVADTAIRIKDISGNDRSTSAVYALVSHGKNGHGAYGRDLYRVKANSTNTDELTNCHCLNTGSSTSYYGNYVQRSFNLNSGTASSYFDDIVRYKERWQLTTEEDILNDDGYRGPDVVIGFLRAIGGTAYVYKNQCSGFVKQADLSPAPTNIVRGVAFTAGNKHLVTYSAAGCYLYKINPSGTLTYQTNGFATACPYNATAVMALSNNGYLAVSGGTSSAVIKLWKLSGDKFVALSDLTHSAASVAELSFSLDADFLAVRSATNTSRIYKRRGNTFSSAAADITQPANLSFYNTPRSLSFSPDGKYLLDFEMWSANSTTYIQNWKVFKGTPATFGQLTSYSMIDGGAGNKLEFSKDSKYIIQDFVSGIQGLCKIDPDDVFCGGATSNGSYNVANNPISPTLFVSGSGTANYAFSRDSLFLQAGRDDAFDSKTMRRIGPHEFISYNRPFQNGLAGPSPDRAYDQILAASRGAAMAFSH